MKKSVAISIFAASLPWKESAAFSGMQQSGLSSVLPQQPIGEFNAVFEPPEAIASTLASPVSMLLSEVSTPGEAFERLTDKVLTESASTNPSFEAEVLQGMAHVALDFTSMLSPSRSLIRLTGIIGRMFALSADYLPDHVIHPEELMIQLFLMGVSMRELIQDKIQRMREA